MVTYTYDKVVFDGNGFGTVDLPYAFTFSLTCPTLISPLTDVLTVIIDLSGSGHYKFIKDQLTCPTAAADCYFYEDPVNWIVYQPAAGTLTSGGAWTLKVSGWTMLYYAT